VGEALAAKYGLKYFECSAKSGAGVEQLFDTVARDISTLLFNQDKVETGHKITKIVVKKQSGCCLH